MYNNPNNEGLSQHEKIFVIMLRDYRMTGTLKFWRASDFQKPVFDLFVGYEASARMSELHKEYHFMFEKRIEDRFRELKLSFVDAKELHKSLPHEMGRHLVREKILI